MNDCFSRVSHVARIAEECNVVTVRSSFERYLSYLFRDIVIEEKSILDVGGGAGCYSYAMCGLGARRVTCLEPEADGSSGSPSEKYRCLGRHLPELEASIDRVQARLQEYSAQQGYQGVLLHNSINHLDEEAVVELPDCDEARRCYRRVVGHIYNMLEVGGWVVVTDCAPLNIFHTFGMKSPVLPNIDWDKHVMPQVWAELMKDVGFEIETIGWSPINRLKGVPSWLTGNRLVAYCGKSHFRIVARR